MEPPWATRHDHVAHGDAEGGQGGDAVTFGWERWQESCLDSMCCTLLGGTAERAAILKQLEDAGGENVTEVITALALEEELHRSDCFAPWNRLEVLLRSSRTPVFGWPWRGSNGSSNPARIGGKRQTDQGCRRGAGCKYTHEFSSKDEKRSRCWFCGSKQHRQPECPVKDAAKAQPQW